MKPPTKRLPSNRIEMPRSRFVNIPIYNALNKGSEKFREAGYSLELKPHKKRDDITPRLYVSRMHDCGRLLWFELNCPDILVEKPFNVLHDPDNWRTSHMGDILEDYVIYLLELGGIKVYNRQNRVSFYNNRASGRIDGMFMLKGEEFLLEIKALKHDKIVEFATYGIRIAAPHYYEQMQSYMCSLGRDGYLIAFDCDNKQFYVEKVKQDITTFEWVGHKMKTILEAKAIQQLPEHVLERECFFCPAQEVCKIIDKKNFEQLYSNYQEKKDAQFKAIRESSHRRV